MLKTKIWQSVLLFCFFSISVTAQNWLTGNGGATNDEALDIVSDTVGNYYVTGYYTSQAKFGSTTLVSNGNSDIFIAKYNSAGIIQWAISAGGSKTDRANSIKVDNAGNVFVTGLYYESAQFGSTTIMSQSNSQDVFIAKYDTNGNLVWVRTVGGSDAETGYGITIDKEGNVIVTGQFQGASIFGTTTLTSTINPTTGVSSFDIFTTKFDATGNFLWVKQGKAKFDDRGLDVAVDDANNIFVVGQFSDTVQFDVVHNNPSINAGYLMKYDKNGNEQWFIRVNSQQTLINSIDVDKNNNIIITGDYEGTLRIYTTPIVTNTSSYQYKIFISKFNNSGSLIWVDNDGSDSEVSSKSIALDNQGNAYIAGLFRCKFDEYSQQYGDGIFYSSGYRDVFVTKYSTSGQREWFKQFGSNRDDYCSGIAVKIIDKPIIAGSFENYFNVPYSPAFTIFNTNNTQNAGVSGYCSNPDYQSFIYQSTAGQKDIFVTSAIDTTSNQAPFDYFQRSGSVCNQNFVTPCIQMCEDTIHSCGPIIYGLSANSFELDTNTIGAQYNYNWSTGSQFDTSKTITTSGLYWLKSERKDGCFQNQDSVYVVIHNVPWITDSYSININQPPFTTPILICKGDTVTIWGTHTGVRDSVNWLGPNHITINDSTIKTGEGGIYYFKTFGAINCDNSVEVIVDTFAIHDILGPHVIFNDSLLQATDTIRICEGEWSGVKVIDSAFYSVNNDLIPFKKVKWTIVGGGSLMFDTTFSNHQNYFTFYSTGWYTINATLYNYCGDSVVYPMTKPFYGIVYPAPIISLNITGPGNTCPNDTVTLYATSNVTNFFWLGNNIIQDFHDSVKVIAPPPESDEYYHIGHSFTDSITGCSYSNYSNFILHSRFYPQVTVLPTDGIICPNDSALLTCESGLNYNWFAPTGNNIGTTQSIYVDVPGAYFCIQTSTDGCTQSSNYVEVKEYNTPYLEVDPSNNICPNQSATISALASSLAIIEWQSPLSGNAVSQTVSAPGAYKCHITQCGILTIDSIIITQADVPSFITASDSILCPGDTLILNGNGGMVDYNWVSKNSNNPYLHITQPGTYTLETTDANGCVGSSAPFVVTANLGAVAPSVSDITICSGQTATINATALTPVLWYGSPFGGAPIYIGNPFTTPVINQDTIYYIQTDNSGCKSVIVPIHINVFSSSISAITDKDTLLLGESTMLHAFTDSTYTVNWIPSESLSNSHSFNPIASPLVSTTYTVSILDVEGCPKIATVFIFVSPANCDFSDIFIPNTFTPNGDGNNDVLYVRGNEISELYFAVYNRWGQMVFETTDINKGWDGNYKGMPADPVVFDWYVRAKCFSGKAVEKKGNVTLVR